MSSTTYETCTGDVRRGDGEVLDHGYGHPAPTPTQVEYLVKVKVFHLFTGARFLPGDPGDRWGFGVVGEGPTRVDLPTDPVPPHPTPPPSGPPSTSTTRGRPPSRTRSTRATVTGRDAGGGRSVPRVAHRRRGGSNDGPRSLPPTRLYFDHSRESGSWSERGSGFPVWSGFRVRDLSLGTDEESRV